METSNRRTKVHNYSMWMKVISCILSFLMVLYAVPTSVFAEIASLASQVSAVGTDEITEKSTSAKIYEVVDRREETVKHFRSEDGSFTAVQYNMPVHEKDENGMWQDIDNTLSSDGSEYATSNARIKFAKKTTGNGNLFTLHDGNRKITMSLSGANKKVAGQVTNTRTDFAEDATQLQKMTTLDKLSSKILYQEILTGVDLEYVVEPCNIKENIIVKEQADSYNYTFEIKLNNLEAMLCEDGSVIISEPNADEVFYTIPKGYMFDSAGNCSDAVTYTLTNGGNGKYSLVVSADADWINNSDRTFPVTVDPTIEYDNYDYNNVVESTYVTSGDSFADANYFSDNHLYVGYSANKGYYSTYVQMKSMPTLPNNATIVDAKLHMMVSGVNNGPAYIGIYRVTESWSANTLTYSSKPNHNSTPIDYRKVGGTVGFDWDITTLVNQWVDGTYSNYGVVLSMVATSDSSAVITLKSERMTKSVPSFVITYRDTKGIEPYYSYYSSGADLAGTGKVNAFTGNLAFIHSSVSTTDEILPYTSSLAYNSCLSGKYYVGGQNVITPIASASTGKGFKLSFDETIEKIDLGDDNELYVWADADGTEHYFSVFDYAWIDESINGYCDEDGLGLYLADEAEDETGTGYLMTDDIGNKKHFDSYGYLDYVEDSNGNRRKFYRNTYHKVTSISLTPNGGTEFTQLQLVYTSANGVLKTITSAQTGLTADMYYSSTYDGEATQDTSGFLRKIIYTYATNYTRTVLYEYDSSGYPTLTKDLKSGAAVNYTYSSTGKVTAITQYGKATETSTVSTMEQGQKARIRYGSLYSYYRTPGKDSIFGSSDDVYTYYRFDHSGRVISSHTTDSDLLYGAANCTYEDTSVKTNNSLASVMQLSGNTVNYLNNPGFEELTYEDVPLYWNTSEECYGYANVINNYDTHLNMMVDCNNPIAYASQVFKLKAGTYTASAFFSRGLLSSNSRARIAIYDSSNTLVASSDYVTAFGTDMPTMDVEEQKSVSFVVDSSDCYTNGWTLAIEFEFITTPDTNDCAFLSVDSVMLEKSAGASRYSMLGNGGFESSNSSTDVTGWTLKDAACVTSSFDGRYGVKVTGNPAKEAYAKTTLIINSGTSSQTYTATPESYAVSGWARGNSAKTEYPIANKNNKYGQPIFALKAVVHYVGSSETTITYIPFDDHNTQWQFATGIVASELTTCGAYYRIASIDLYCCYDHNINTAYFDGISVVKDTDCVTRYSYNDYGYVSKVDGSDGNSTFYTYDFNGLDVNKVYSSNGNSIDFDYDDNHQLISEINTNATNNFKIEYTYNDYGKVISTKITDNQEGRYSINSSVNLSTDTVNFGAVIEETDENDRTTKTFYDKKARITGTCGNDGYGVIYTYNRYGQITRVQEAVYDESTQTMKAFSGGSSVISTYNSKGNASAIRTPSATYTFGYDSFNNVTQISVNGRTLLSITYEDYNGNIAKNEYGNGDWVEYQYDNVNRVSEVWHSDYSDNAVFTYTYNANGNLSEYVDNINGRSYTYMYDQKGSLTQRVIKELNADSDADAVTCVEQYAYDDQGRMIDIYYNYLDTTEVPTLSYYQFTYDVAGNTTQIDYGGTLGHSHYSYDHFGRLDEESLTKGASDTFMFSKEYDYCGSGFTTSYQVDALWIEDSNDQYFDTLYDYDDAGNITSVEIYNDGLIQKFTYEYDGKDQLTRENIYVANHTSISKTITYSYDTSGNITSKKRYAYTEAEDLSDLSYTEIAYGYAVDTQEEIDDTYLNIHDEWNDLLTSFNGSAITYDEIGNPLTYGAYSYTWSNGRQLESVYQVFPYVNTTYQYNYNDEGVRTSKIVSGVKHEYTVSGGRINREVVYSSNGQYVTRDIRYYYDAAGNPISIRAFTRSSSTAAFTDTIYYLLTNMQGDVVAIYNANGERIFEYVYDAWGNILRSKQVATGGNAANSVNPFRYRGYYYDTETGLYYLQSRYYNPEWGRFLNADGYVSTGTGLLGYNMYAYCNNNPVNRIDPTGRFSWLILAAVLLFTPVGGTALQIATSTISYAGMAITSIWDKDVRADMNSIGWNPFNDNESDVQNSSKVSFYKGVPVFRTASGGRSGSFGAIFLTKGSGVDDLRHERGHNWQLMMMGIGTYGYTVGLPSPLRLGKWDRAGNYYGAPWETMADILGGVQGRTHSKLEIANAWGYYAISTITFPFTALYWH